MVRTQISLEADLYEEARREAGRRGISFAELVRRALRQLIPVQGGGGTWMDLAGSVEGGAQDASTTVDRTVYGADGP